MARLLDNTFMTNAEGYSVASRLADNIATALSSLKLDTYNHTYVVRVTVDQVDEPPQAEDDG